MGRFIVIEGLDGSGKTTQSELLVNRLREQGKKVRALSFPRYGEKSCTLVEMYLGGELSSDPDDINGCGGQICQLYNRLEEGLRGSGLHHRCHKIYNGERIPSALKA